MSAEPKRFTNPEGWSRWEGHLVKGIFPLRRFLGGSEQSAVFLSEYDAGKTIDVAIKLVPANLFRPRLSRSPAAAMLVAIVFLIGMFLVIGYQRRVQGAIFGQSKSWQTCGSYFACDTPMTNDENTEWFKHGNDVAKAKELFQKAGYDGRPVVVLQATEWTAVEGGVRNDVKP